MLSQSSHISDSDNNDQINNDDDNDSLLIESIGPIGVSNMNYYTMETKTKLYTPTIPTRNNEEDNQFITTIEKEIITIAILGDYNRNSNFCYKLYSKLNLIDFSWKRTINYNHYIPSDQKKLIQFVSIGPGEFSITNMNKALMVSDYAIIVIENEEETNGRLVNSIRMLNHWNIDRVLLVDDHNIERSDIWIRNIIENVSVVEMKYDICIADDDKLFHTLNNWINLLTVKKEMQQLATQPIKIQMIQTIYTHLWRWGCHRDLSFCTFQVLSGIVGKEQEISFNTKAGERKFILRPFKNRNSYSDSKLLPGQIFTVSDCLSKLSPEDSSIRYKHFVSGNYYHGSRRNIKVDSFWLECTYGEPNIINHQKISNCFVFCNSKQLGRIERIRKSEKGIFIETKVMDRQQTSHDELFSQYGFITTFERDSQFGRVLLSFRKKIIAFGKVISIIYQDMDNGTLLVLPPISLFSKCPMYYFDIQLIMSSA